MLLVHVYLHHNSSNLDSTLTTVASLNLRLDALAEFIIASFLSSLVPRTIISVGFSDHYELPSLSICKVPFHSNIALAIVYKIYKHRLLQYWDDHKLTQMADWEEIDLTPFEQGRKSNTVHMSHFITKCMSKTLSTLTILQQQGHTYANLFPCCGVSLETIQHLYKFTH